MGELLDILRIYLIYIPGHQVLFGILVQKIPNSNYNFYLYIEFII